MVQCPKVQMYIMYTVSASKLLSKFSISLIDFMKANGSSILSIRNAMEIEGHPWQIFED